MKRDDYIASEHSYELMQAAESDERRRPFFATLLLLESGWWERDPDEEPPETLIGYLYHVAEFVIAGCRKRGVRCHAETSEDLAHDTLLTFYKKVKKIESNPRSWLVGTAININRGNRRRHYPLLNATRLEDLKREPEATSKRGRGPRKVTPRQQAVIDKLPRAKRDVANRMVRGESTAEIAKARNTTPDAVRVTIMRMKKGAAAARPKPPVRKSR